MRRSIEILVSSAALLGLATSAVAQQDVIADPAHHKLEFENKCVRVIRANFGAGEKSTAPFDAKDVVIVNLTGSKSFKLNLPEGKSVNFPATPPGQVSWAPGGRIQPENTSDARVEYIVVEPKGCN